MEAIHCNNLEIVRIVNNPVPSNAYIIVDDVRKRCIVIDPGSKKPDDITKYIAYNNLEPDYIILTHEHFDHCWGVNILVSNYPNAKVVTTIPCRDWIKIPMNYFNKLYYDSDECFSIDNVDIVVEDIGMKLVWNDTIIEFIEAKGHTDKGMCILINGILFTGDTIIKDTKPVIKKKYGASVDALKTTIDHIFSIMPHNTLVLSGHGDPFYLNEMREYYHDYFAKHLHNS